MLLCLNHSARSLEDQDANRNTDWEPELVRFHRGLELYQELDLRPLALNSGKASGYVLKNLSEVEFKSSELICLEEKISS